MMPGPTNRDSPLRMLFRDSRYGLNLLIHADWHVALINGYILTDFLVLAMLNVGPIRIAAN
jgi:hypothetical protein